MDKIYCTYCDDNAVAVYGTAGGKKDCPIGVKCVTFDIVNPVSVNTERWKNAEEHTL